MKITNIFEQVVNHGTARNLLNCLEPLPIKVSGVKGVSSTICFSSTTLGLVLAGMGSSEAGDWWKVSLSCSQKSFTFLMEEYSNERILNIQKVNQSSKMRKLEGKVYIF